MKSNTRKVLLGTVTLAALAASGAISDVNAANDSVSITAQIIAPIKITETKAMQFGKMTDGGGGEVTIAAGSEKRSVTAGTVSLVGGTTAQRGGVQIKAATGLAINVTGPTKATIKAGTKSMTVKSFKIGTKNIGATAFVTTLTAGTKTGIRIGGTLTVGAAQATGTYTGAVKITANYQ